MNHCMYGHFLDEENKCKECLIWESELDKLDANPDTHDFFSEEHVKIFLRQHYTGSNNFGRLYLATIVQQYNNPKVIDVGGCTGQTFEVFSNLNVQCQYILFDRTRQFLNYAKTLYGNKILYHRGYVQQLPYADNFAEICLFRHVSEHLSEQDFYQAINELLRVASKEVIIVFFLQPHSGNEHLIEHRGPDERGCYYWWSTYSWSKLVDFFSTFNVQIKTKLVYTVGAAHPDFIVRLIK